MTEQIEEFEQEIRRLQLQLAQSNNQIQRLQNEIQLRTPTNVPTGQLRGSTESPDPGAPKRDLVPPVARTRDVPTPGGVPNWGGSSAAAICPYPEPLSVSTDPPGGAPRRPPPQLGVLPTQYYAVAPLGPPNLKLRPHNPPPPQPSKSKPRRRSTKVSPPRWIN